MIYNVIEGSIKNNSLNKLSLSRVCYERADNGGLMRNYGPTMIYLLFKIINPYTSIGVSNLKN